MKTRVSCRVCDGSLESIFSLGDQYVSDFIKPDEPDGFGAPLEIVLCQRCRLLQLKHTVPAEHMYRNYWYRSGTNRTMRDALADVANKAEQLVHLQKGDGVLDIGCNDGTLLHAYKTGGLFKIGFDPARNMEQYSREIADRLFTDFFSAQSYRNDDAVRDVRPKVVTSIAMFYDLEDPKQFVGDVKEVMDPDGVWIVQMSYLPLMLKTNEIGNICHEHLEYYSLQSLEYLIGMYDMEVVDMELNDVNGGSMRVYVRNKGANKNLFGDSTYRELAWDRLHSFRRSEVHLGLDTPEPYLEFAERVTRLKEDVVTFIQEHVSQSNKVYVYGASTKGNTVLQYFGLDNSIITAAAERNPDKWGKVTVGTRIPIISEEEARAAKPEYMLVLPWHFLEEFKIREKAYLRAGGRFILPMPHFTLI